ncbi:MAG: AlbA family DNA-binding domain-containing protein [Solirubrobacterales bacterium]
MIARGVREATDLDFKRQVYGGNEKGKRSFAGDIAAMANERGGLILIGVIDADGAASDLNSIELSETEELRMRSIAADLISPHVSFEIQRIPSADNDSSGFYAIIIPPSPDRPHAVSSGVDLRYPRRDGARTRYMRQPEVAAEYVSREQRGKARDSRLDRALHGGLAQLDLDQAPWLELAMVPSVFGSDRVDRVRQKEVADWLDRFRRPANAWDFGESFLFNRVAGQPSAGVGVGRFIARPRGEQEAGLARYAHVELHTTGAGYAATTTYRREDHEPVTTDFVVAQGAAMLQLLAAHAIENAGCVGDAIAELRLSGPQLRLGWQDMQLPGAFAHAYEVPPMNEPISSRISVSVDAVVASKQDLLSTTALLTSGITQAFGVAEPREVQQDGTIVKGFWPIPNDRLEEWAATNEVPLA